MKKTLLASTLILLSSNAIAGDIFNSYEKRKSSIELSAINYELDGEGFKEDQVGGRVRYQSLDSMNFGYQLSHEGFNYDKNGLDLTLQLSTIGINYQFDIYDSGLYLKPEIGAYYLQGDLEVSSEIKNELGYDVSIDDSETNGYGKITLGGSLIENKLDFKVHYTHYNHSLDNLSNGATGGQLNYHFNRDFDLILQLDKFEDLTMYGIGISINYF